MNYHDAHKTSHGKTRNLCASPIMCVKPEFFHVSGFHGNSFQGLHRKLIGFLSVYYPSRWKAFIKPSLSLFLSYLFFFFSIISDYILFFSWFPFCAYVLLSFFFIYMTFFSSVFNHCYFFQTCSLFPTPSTGASNYPGQYNLYESLTRCVLRPYSQTLPALTSNISGAHKDDCSSSQECFLTLMVQTPCQTISRFIK